MSSTAYRVLGWAVWKGGTWYVRRRWGSTPRNVAAVVAVGAGIGVFVAAQRRGAGDG